MSVFVYKETTVDCTQLILRKHDYKQEDSIFQKQKKYNANRGIIYSS